MSHFRTDRYRSARLAHRAAEARRRVAAPLGCRAWEQPEERGQPDAEPVPEPMPAHMVCSCPTAAEPWERCVSCRRARPDVHVIRICLHCSDTTAA